MRLGHAFDDFYQLFCGSVQRFIFVVDVERGGYSICGFYVHFAFRWRAFMVIRHGSQ